MLTELNPTNFCILGDLNARIGEEQVVDENELQDLGLNAKCFKANTDGYCTICNTKEPENTLHLLVYVLFIKTTEKFILVNNYWFLSEVINILNDKSSFK